MSEPLRSGVLTLDPSQAHHVRDVLRLKTDDPLELFDNAGNVALVRVQECDPHHVAVMVEQVQSKAVSREIIVASAVPKGDRADWMVEKLSELGVSRFIPLAAARSVVLPTGQNKRERWVRLATEAAKQSRRNGVMKIHDLTPLDQLLKTVNTGYYLSTREDAPSFLSSFIPHPSSLLLIGPEGGWTDEEMEQFAASGLTGVKLTGTILRLETAAVAAAAIVACWSDMRPEK